jgi:hypothetical protein
MVICLVVHRTRAFVSLHVLLVRLLKRDVAISWNGRANAAHWIVSVQQV